MSFFWNLREYRDGDEHAIVELLKTTLLGWRSCAHAVEYWRWKYWRNPAGSPVIWLAEHNNRVIGHYGIIPVRMKVGNSYVNGSVSCDGAVHPTYQGKGIFSSIVNRCYLDVAKKGIPLTYMFPRVRLGPTYKRFEWRGHICFLVNMIKVLNWSSVLGKTVLRGLPKGNAVSTLAKIGRHGPVNGCSKIERLSHFDERVDRFWRKISRRFEIIVKRDQAYLNWRYVANPSQEYALYAAVKDFEILGYCALRCEQYKGLLVGSIADIIGFQDDYDVVRHLIWTAFEHFKERRVDVISCNMPEKHPYRLDFMKLGFFPKPRPRCAICATINLPGSCINEKMAYSQALLLSQSQLLKKKEDWFMMIGDAG